MKITANRKEDILRRKAEYEEDVARRIAQVEKEEQEFREAEYAVTDPVKHEIEKLFEKYPTLHAEVRVESAPFRQAGLRVQVSVNEREKFSDSTAISWSYDVYLNDNGEVKRETNSWSGMQAVTADQLRQLEETVAVLKELLEVDWASLLNKEMPRYRDYLKTDDPRYERDRPNFNRELAEAEMEDIIGQRKMIEVKPFSGSWYYDARYRANKNVFIAIIKDSGSQYTIKECPMYEYNAGNASKYFDDASAHRVKKASIVPVSPINIIDV